MIKKVNPLPANREQPECLDWAEPDADCQRRLGFLPALTLGALTSAAIIGSANPYGHNFCHPRSYYGRRDYYTCSPRFICLPVPYWAGPTKPYP